MDRISQTMPPPLPLHYPQSFCLLHLSFRYLSALSLSFALSIPKSPFSLDCLGLINLVLNLETYFSKTPGLEREDRRQNGLSNPCLSSFIYLFEKREAVTEIPLSLLSLCCCHNFFCPPHFCPRRPHLN